LLAVARARAALDALGIRTGHTAEIAACIDHVLRLEVLRVIGPALKASAVRAAESRPLRARADCARRAPAFVPTRQRQTVRGATRWRGGVEGVLFRAP
jgi:hypothetical protein